MLNLLNNPTFDNTRNELNAQLFVNNLKNTLKAFGFNPKVSYEVYRNITLYNIKWLDDKTSEDLKEYKKEIALSLGISSNELHIKKINENEVTIKVPNMKKDILTLKELLSDYKKTDRFEIALGLDEEDNIVTFDFEKDKSLLVAGTSGIGKTNLFKNIIMNILINYPDTKMLILDSQGINYNEFSEVCEVINDEQEIINKIRNIRKDFEEKIKNKSNETLVVFIDEIYEILQMSDSVDEDINYLSLLGNIVNIYLVVSTDSILDSNINRIFTNDTISKLSFYLTSRGEYNMFLNTPVKEDLHNDGIYQNVDKELTRITIPLIDEEEIKRVVEYEKENK